MINKRYDHRDTDDLRSDDIQQQIAATRREMDETLDALGDRLHPKHLFDVAVEYVRSLTSGSGQQAKDQVKQAGRQVTEQVKKHPVPYAMIAVGAIWRLIEGSKDEREMFGARSSDGAAGGYGEFRAEVAGNPVAHERQWGPGQGTILPTLPWQNEHDWSGHKQSEDKWKARAKGKLQSLKRSLEDPELSTADKLKHSAMAILESSGRKRRDVHRQWADLEEHSGSAIDARTGEPYDDEAYARRCYELVACDYFADYDETDEDASSWRERAGDVVDDIRSALSNGGENVTATLGTIAGKIGTFAEQSGSVAKSSGRRVRGRMSQIAHQGRSGMHHVSERASAGMDRVSDEARYRMRQSQEGLRRGYSQTRQQVSEGVDRYPLAAGMAALGVGLLAGALLPSTRKEDKWMGSTSEQVKGQAQEATEDVMDRGRQVASATAEAAQDEARKQGLTPKRAGEKARSTVANATKRAGEQLDHAVNKATDRAENVADRAAETAKEETKRQMKQ